MINGQTIPAFKIGSIPIYGDVLLAPMDGYTDMPFRSLARKLGSAASYTEFLNAVDVISQHHSIPLRAAYQEWERPVFFQLLDNQPERLLEAAQRLLPLQPDGFDINLGCPARTVAGRGAGAGLLREPEKIRKIFYLFRQAFSLPVTAKMRIGWGHGEPNTHIELAQLLEDSGASALIVHGRTRQQAYQGKANWDAIAEVRQAVTIPVIGNGDVQKVADIRNMKIHTGCQGVMIGRAAIFNPWIFCQRERDQVLPWEVESLILQQLELNLEFYGIPRGLILLRKFAKNYLRYFSIEPILIRRLMTTESVDDFRNILHGVIMGI